VRRGRCLAAVGLAVSLLAGCTYAPEERRVTVEQVVRFGDGYDALVVVRYDRFRRPTGLSAFPDGGKQRMLGRRATLYRTNAIERTAHALARTTASDAVWESYDVHVRAIEADSVAYLASTGCPMGGECHPPLQRTELLRVTSGGEARKVAEIPAGAGLPGVMLAREPGEQRYVRWSSTADVVSARLDERGAYEPAFQVGDDGSLTSIAGDHREPPGQAGGSEQERGGPAEPCDGPGVDPWIGELRDRVLSYDGLALWAVDAYGGPRSCDGAVTDEFDGAKFGAVTLGFANGVALTVETMPPEVSIVSLRAPAGFADGPAVLRSLRAYAAARGLAIDWDAPPETSVDGDESTATYWDPDTGLNGSASVVTVDDALVEVRVSMAL
jgi:hypothetical protein